MAEYLMIAAVEAEPGDEADTMRIHATAVDGVQVYKPWFEDNAVEIEPGTGAALKAVAATALLGAIASMRPEVPFLPQDAANDEQTAAQRGEFNDDMIAAVARIGFNVVREWRKYEGLLHHPPYDEASELQQNIAKSRIRNIAENKRYPLDVANKAMVFEDQLYRIVTAAVLAD